MGQLLQLIPRHVFDHLVDTHAWQGPNPRKFTYWSHLGAMLFGQWSARKSLRDLAFSLNSFAGYLDFMIREYRSLNRLTADELVALITDAGFHIVREERSRMELSPPADLLARHSPEDLLTNEIRLLLTV